ncbi:AAA family ATPase [bacterium]|nr:AAA family ATPase [bacterium]
MYLKNIYLRGFKSFGTKSNLSFEPGISIIVGPNGSGKSNIVDAISWVLGEQSPKSLRSTSMGDVIFKNKNEELAIAEVSLIFDNTDRILPVEFAEVKFTRRIYIKGGSEYFINSSPCRLADIQDITAESGIGKGLYTIISQGQVNNVILYKPVDRKHIIDEIIGVSRHKIRRDKSRERLNSIESDVNRVSDLLHEVKRTLDPLAIEAQKSKIFFDLSQEMKNQEISLFISNINQLNKKWDDEEANFERNSSELDEIDRKIQIINAQKREFESLFYKEKEDFNKLEDKFNTFNILENKLINLKSMALSQKTSVETIINMINFSISDISNTFNNKDIFKEDSSGKQIVERKEIESAVEKIDGLINMVGEFFKKIRELIDENRTRELDRYEEVFVRELNSIKNIFYLTNKDSDEAQEDITVKPAIAENKMIKIEDRLKRLKEIMEYAQKNMNNLNLFLKKSVNLLEASKKLDDEINIKLDREKEKINSSQPKLNRYYEELNKLGSKKHFLENEIYRSNLKKEQIKEKVKDLSIKIFDEYNMPVDYIVKNFKQSENVEQCEARVRELRGELLKYKNVNPNAHIEFEKVKERFEFLDKQRNDLNESRKNLEKLILELNQKIKEYFSDKFNEINENFKYYFKILFPLGEGELLLTEIDESDDFGIDIKADIGNNKSVSLQLLSGGEKALVSIAYLFAIFAVNSSPFYIFDEIDAALDDANLSRFLTLARIFAQGRQIIMITHQKKTMEVADIIYGFTMQSNGVTKIVSEKIRDNYVQAG